MRPASKSRYYLKLDEEIRRLPNAFFDWQSNHSFQHFAGTKQKIIEALYDDGRLNLHGSYIHFDAKGHLDRVRTNIDAVEVLDAADRIDRAKRMAVVDLPMIVKAKAQRSQHRWQVTDADREAIVADLILTGRRHKGIPILHCDDGNFQAALSAVCTSPAIANFATSAARSSPK